MKYNTVFALLLVLAGFASTCLAATSFIIPPIRPHGEEVGLIFIPGADIRGEAYRQTALSIQHASDLRLWIALTGNYTAGVPNPLEVPGAIQGSVQALQKAGMKGGNFAGIGHSLGGVFLASYAAGKTPLKSIILLGSYISRNVKLGDYPIPILTLSGELDGQTRITRIALDYEQLQKDIQKSPQALFRTPVINIKGSSHAQFASGPMPPNVRRYDLQPDISDEEAHAQIGKDCSDFLTSTFGTTEIEVDKARQALKVAYAESGLRFQPLLNVKALDVNGTMSPWAVSSQSFFAGQYLPRVKVTNVLKTSSSSFIFSKPSLTKTATGIEVGTTAFIVYQYNPLDISTTPESPWEIDVKMKSRDAIAKALSQSKGPSNEDVNCMDINKRAFELALKSSTADSRARYVKRGRPMTFGEDIVYGTGIQWVGQGFQMNEDDSGLHVQSVALMTSTSSPQVPGMHYCKVLSPYRAMEWINVDSLRKHKP